jgi:hypothetical protein
MFPPHVRLVCKLTGKTQDFPKLDLRSARGTARILNRDAVSGNAVVYRAAFVVRLNEDGKTLRTLLEECKA